MSDSNHPPERDDPQLRQILDAAADLPADQRAAYLDEACCGNIGLRAEVRALLMSLDEAGEFLADPTVSPAPGPEESPGSRIGRYKLVEKVGEGGMGVVYVAEQEHPVRRRVAIKVIKLGMDTREVVARFEAERQALAMMDHPNIARVLDAGATDAGRPYFVMELVRGVSITEYCDAEKLSTRRRLELFVPVCRAVQHAHQKGVIHRDLKPSNVLVTLHDGVAVPKVIDFGVAKATDGRLTDKTVYTEFHQFVGTPEYMSPEQAEMSGLDIDTRADVYALGVLLYELLTGTTPVDGKALRRAAFAEIRRIIREVEPPKPSTRLSTLGDALAAVAERRGVEPKRLGAVLRGDLDWIVMRCLEKDRTRRYETANALATDVQRHLNDEPVEASPPSAGYWLRKAARKHRKEAVAVVAVMGALLLGIIGTSAAMVRSRVLLGRAQAAEKLATVQRNEAKRALSRSERQAARANAVSDFMESIIASARPTNHRRPDDVRVVELLADAAVDVGERLGDQPEAEAQVRGTLGVTYLKVGKVEEARKQLQRAYDVACSAPGGEIEQALRAASQLISAMDNDPPGAESLARRCHEVARRELGDDNALTQRLDADIAASLSLAGKFARAAEHYGGLIDRARARGKGIADNPKLYADYALALLKSGDAAGAEVIQRQVYELLEGHPDAGEGVDTPRSLRTYGEILVALGRRDEAKNHFERAIGLQRERLGRTHPDTQDTLLRYAELLEATGDSRGALQQHRALQEIDRQLHRLDGASSLRRRVKMAALLRRLGRRQEATDTMTEVLARAGAAMRVDPGEAEDVFHETLLIFAGMGPPGWKCPALFTNLWSSMEEYFFSGASLEDLELGRVDGDGLRFRLERWDPSGGVDPQATTIVADGDVQQLKELAEPGLGVYRLVLDRAGPDGVRVPAWVAWLFFANWEVDLYTFARQERDPEAYQVLLQGKPSAHCRVTNLSLPQTEPKPSAWPGGDETYLALAATSFVDLPRGRYRFSTTSDDGVRLYVDGGLVIDSWLARNAERDDAVLDLASGRHELRVEYFQARLGMRLRVQLAPAADVPLTSLPVRGSNTYVSRRRKAAASRTEAALTEEIRQSPSSAQALFDRAQFLMGECRYAESARDYAEGLKINPAIPWHWANSAAVALQVGDIEGYRRQCVEMVRRFGATTNRNDCERVVRNCTVLPDAVPDLDPVMAMADRAVAPDDVHGPSFMRTLTALAKGMAEYRAGHFESAVHWLERSIPGMDSSGQSCAYFFLAMAEAKCGRVGSAEAAFGKGEELYQSDGPRGDAFPQPYKEWIIALQARGQAAAVLGLKIDSLAAEGG